MANNIVYTLHNFKDVSDEMSEIIQLINMYKTDYNIVEANRYAESQRSILGDMVSPDAINEMEQGIINIEKSIMAKKMSVIISKDYPTIYDEQSWIQPIDEEPNSSIETT